MSFRVLYADPLWAVRDGRPDLGQASIERDVYDGRFSLELGVFEGATYVREGPRFVERARGADAMLVSRVRITPEIVAALEPTCRLVVRQGIGYDNLNPALLKAHGILGYCVPDYCVDEVSNHTLAMILALERRIVLQNARVKAGQWGTHATGYPRRLSNLTLGIVGFGRIGATTARKAGTIYKRVTAYDPYVSGDLMAGHRVERRERLADLLAEADVVAIHALLNDETFHLIDRASIAHMKPDAILVNTARGNIVAPEAVLDRLEAGKLGGYAADVFDPEDPNADPLNKRILEFDNTLVSSHCAFLSAEAEASIRRRVAELIVAVLTTGNAPTFGRVA